MRERVDDVNRRRLLATILLAAFVVLLAPVPAPAQEVLVTRDVQTRTGVDMALDVVGRVRNVEIGSTAATLTIDAGEGLTPVSLSYGEALEGMGVDPGRGRGIVPLLALTFGVSGFLRFLGLLVRLAR